MEGVFALSQISSSALKSVRAQVDVPLRFNLHCNYPYIPPTYRGTGERHSVKLYANSAIVGCFR